MYIQSIGMKLRRFFVTADLMSICTTCRKIMFVVLKSFRWSKKFTINNFAVDRFGIVCPCDVKFYTFQQTNAF